MLLLDTSATIELLRGAPVPDALDSETVGVSTIVEMELHLGALHGGGRKEQKRVDAFLRECIVYPFDSDAALETAKVLAELWSTGRPIGDFDSQIAGHARLLDLPLLTANARHFKRVKGLKVIEWNG
jgi:tRNA(fMet)-specific endonuclease VapC